MAMGRRQVAYYSLRAIATLTFVLSAFVLRRGALAAGLCIAAGLVAVFSGIGVNAGGPGEQAGARRQMDYVEPVPQGDWPPFDPGRDIDGEAVDPDPRLSPP